MRTLLLVLSVFLTGCVTSRVTEVPVCASELSRFYQEASELEASLSPPLVTKDVQVYQFLPNKSPMIHQLCFVSVAYPRSSVGCGKTGDMIGVCRMQGGQMMYYGYNQVSLDEIQKLQQQLQEQKDLPL
jgi:hypothetical protein